MNLATIAADHLPRAEMLLTKAHILTDDLRAGAIEFAAMDETGRCWLVGWTYDFIPDALGALVLDRRKFPAVLVLARYGRSDVPPGASGFIGLLQADWKPTAGTGQIVLVLAAEGIPHFLSVGASLRIVPIREVAAAIEAVGADGVRGPFDDLMRLLTHAESWVPGLARAAKLAPALGLDAVVGIPGVGFMVEGWVISPTEPVREFVLRSGDAVLRIEPRASFRRQRPDLEGAYAHQAELTRDAGFVAFFPADVRAGQADLTLKLIYASGVSTNHAIKDEGVLWLHRGAGEAALLRCYPALECEPFFPALARAMKAERLLRRPGLMSWKHVPAETLLVRAVGEHPSDAFSAMEEILSLQEVLAARAASVAILAPFDLRGVVLPLYAELRDAGLSNASLFFGRPAFAPADLAQILRETRAGRFVFLREGFRTDIAAIEACLEHLAGKATMPGLIALDDTDAWSVLDHPAALAWRAEGLFAHAEKGLDWSDLPRGRALGLGKRTRLRAPPRPLAAKLHRALVIA